MAALPVPCFGSARTLFPKKSKKEEEEDELTYQRHQVVAAGLPDCEDGLFHLRQLGGFWLPESTVPGILAAREHFVARPTDVVLASFPKCGTTWLKSLVFSVVSRHGDRHPRSPRHPLLELNPHECVPLLEELYSWHKNPNLEILRTPRLLSTHVSLSLLPDSMISSTSSSGCCRLIYVCRNPKDSIVSRWHFLNGISGPSSGITFDAFFDMFMTGAVAFGPMWEHVLGYWEEHRKRPEEVMFLRYEDVKREPEATVRRLAAFVGCPFSEEEEREGLVESVVSLCSLDNMKRVNRDGVVEPFPRFLIEKKLFFRKGEVGDWTNHLTPEMAERVDEITQQKLQASGLML